MSKNEITLKKNGKFITRYGSTLETEQPTVVYLRTKSKITPSINKKEYNTEVVEIKTRFSTFVENSIKKCKSVHDEFLFNIDISSKSVRYGKVSFLRYDLYVKPYKVRTIEENRFRLQQLSTKLDKQLEHLLNTNNIICK